MPPRPGTRCVAYTGDNSGLFFMPGVEEWLTGPDRPTPQGRVEFGGRRGIVYNVEALWEESQHRPKWPAAVRDWLRSRRGTPEALVVVWE